MKSTSAGAFWTELDGIEDDRAPGAPFLGFLSGSLISLGLWAAITLVALSVIL